jgi:DNA polymerase-1
MTTLLIDGDTIAYAGACIAETAIEWEPGQLSVSADEGEAKQYVDDALDALKIHFSTKDVVVAISDATEKGWRRDVLPTYKSNRANVRKPLALPAVRRHLAAKWKAYLRPTLEGDDVLGILATHRSLVKGDKVVVSIDKDMLTIPGTHYNPTTKETRHVREDEADHYHLLQSLSGDTVDGYRGCPGIGPVRAREVLEGVEGQDRWLAIVAAYEKKGLTEADALVQARVARILRACDYDFKTKKVKLWTPT